MSIRMTECHQCLMRPIADCQPSRIFFVSLPAFFSRNMHRQVQCLVFAFYKKTLLYCRKRNYQLIILKFKIN